LQKLKTCSIISYVTNTISIKKQKYMSREKLQIEKEVLTQSLEKLPNLELPKAKLNKLRRLAVASSLAVLSFGSFTPKSIAETNQVNNVRQESSNLTVNSRLSEGLSAGVETSANAINASASYKSGGFGITVKSEVN
jgi:hypothetical protein